MSPMQVKYQAFTTHKKKAEKQNLVNKWHSHFTKALENRLLSGRKLMFKTMVISCLPFKRYLP